jgi:uncharacterized protein YjbI with pentapeptide repeats
MSYYKELNNYDIENENVELNRPTGANLIEGFLTEVILFLDKLSAVPESNEKDKWNRVISKANGGKVLKK